MNLIALHRSGEGAKESLNVQGAYLEVLADTIGSVGAAIAAILLELFGWNWIPSSLLHRRRLGLVGLGGTYRLGAQASVFPAVGSSTLRSRRAA